MALCSVRCLVAMPQAARPFRYSWRDGTRQPHSRPETGAVDAESEKMRGRACGGARCVYRVDAAGWTDVTRAGATDVPGRPVLAEAAAAQMDHAAGTYAGRRS